MKIKMETEANVELEMEKISDNLDLEIYHADSMYEGKHVFIIKVGYDQVIIENTSRENFCEMICENIISKIPPHE